MRFDYILHEMAPGIKWIFAAGVFIVSPKYELEFILTENGL